MTEETSSLIDLFDVSHLHVSKAHTELISELIIYLSNCVFVLQKKLGFNHVRNFDTTLLQNTLQITTNQTNFLFMWKL